MEGFQALLSEHAGAGAGAGAAGAAGVAGTAGAVNPLLDMALSAPRGDAGGGGGFREARLAQMKMSGGNLDKLGGRDGGRGGRERGGRPSRGGGGRHRESAPAITEELEAGTIRYVKVWGDYPKWDPEEWSSEEAGDIVVQFEAKADDNIVVALSAEAQLTMPMYEVVIGGWKDSKSVIRREPQGYERAVVEQPFVCSSKAYRWYWVMLKQGVVSAGVGERPGKGVLVAWRDPEPLAARFASFSTWDHVVTYRSVRVDACDTDMLLELPDALLESWTPGFVARADGELEEAREAARRSGVLFHAASAALSAQAGLTEEEAEGIRRMRAAAGDNGFVTGFDPTTEEERAKAAARAARFGTGASESAGADKGAGPDGDAEMMSREKREARAKRFGVPLIEDEQVGKGLLRDLTGLRVPRKDAEEQHAKRAEAINIYGLFDQIYTRDIIDWFSEFGASRVEWLHDCSANVVFADSHTAKRAAAGLSVTIPSIAGFEAAVEDLINKGYTCAPFPMSGEQGHRFFLVRTASAGDVKAAEKQYHTNIGFDRARLGKVPGGNLGFGRKMIEVIRNKAAQAAAMKAEERVTGAKSKRRDSEDEDQDEGDARAKARRTADDDEVEVAAADDAE